jgi:hypothetical protein
MLMSLHALLSALDRVLGHQAGGLIDHDENQAEQIAENNWQILVATPITDQTFAPRCLRDVSKILKNHVVEYDLDKDSVIKRVLPYIIRVKCDEFENELMQAVQHSLASQDDVELDELCSYKIASKFREITAETTPLPVYVCRALIGLHVENGILIHPLRPDSSQIVSMKFTVVDLYLGYLYDHYDMPVCLCNAVVHSKYREENGQLVSVFTQRISIVPIHPCADSEALIAHYEDRKKSLTAEERLDPFRIDVNLSATDVPGEEWRKILLHGITNETFFPMYLRDYTQSASVHEHTYDRGKDGVISRHLYSIRRVRCDGFENALILEGDSQRGDEKRSAAYLTAHTFREITPYTLTLPLNICRALINEHISANIQTRPVMGGDDFWRFDVVDLYLAYLGNQLVCLCNAAVYSVDYEFTGPRREYAYDTQRISIVRTALYFDQNNCAVHPNVDNQGDPKAPFYIKGYG